MSFINLLFWMVIFRSRYSGPSVGSLLPLFWITVRTVRWRSGQSFDGSCPNCSADWYAAKSEMLLTQMINHHLYCHWEPCWCFFFFYTCILARYTDLKSLGTSHFGFTSFLIILWIKTIIICFNTWDGDGNRSLPYFWYVLLCWIGAKTVLNREYLYYFLEKYSRKGPRGWVFPSGAIKDKSTTKEFINHAKIYL